MNPKRGQTDLNKNILCSFEVPNIISKDQGMVSPKKPVRKQLKIGYKIQDILALYPSLLTRMSLFLTNKKLGDLGWIDYRDLKKGSEAFEEIHNGTCIAPKIVLIP